MAVSEIKAASIEIGYQRAAGITAAGLAFVLGLGVSRLLFEALFPRLLWLGRPLPVFLIAGVTAILGWFFWRRISVGLLSGSDPPSGLVQSQAAWTATAIFLPLGLNLFYLINRQVDLVASRFLFFCSLWLMVLFLARLLARPATWRWLGFIMLIAFLAPIYLSTLGQDVGMADTFEFQVVAPRLGIVHPTGYPLYLLLAKIFTFIPFNSVAWRVNLASAIFGLAAVSLLYVLGWRLTRWSLISLLIAALFGLTPTFWSQAIEAEVYTLHALLVIAALLLMREIGDWRLIGLNSIPHDDLKPENNQSTKSYTLTILLAFVLGLGLANHLTTLILLPPAALTIFFAWRAGRFRQAPANWVVSVLLVVGALLLPLLLYSYLPLRWSAVNGEPMGFSRFLDWVIGGRFQGALQLNAWLNDAGRYDVVGRLLANDWPFIWTGILIFVGAGYLFLWQWRYALILLLTWLGYVFYALSYYVPDLAVFVIPAQIIIAIWWLAGIVAGLDLVTTGPGRRKTLLIEILFVMAGIVPLLVAAADRTWVEVDRSAADGRTTWAQAVLAQPLPEGATILADSDKFPPLYYLQQAHDVRPDLDIMVLPDEPAYRAELEARLAAGQPLYLARYIPGLEGLYHLNSAGPLTQLSREPETTLPAAAELVALNFGPIQLVGYSLQIDSPYSAEQSAVTTYWRADKVQDQVLLLYSRWAGEDYAGPISVQHPANNNYPTVAWRPGEIVTDYRPLPRPLVNETTLLDLQVAVAPPFTDPDDLSWQVLATVPVRPALSVAGTETLRSRIGPVPVDGLLVPSMTRPFGEIPVTLSGYGPNLDQLLIALQPPGEKSTASTSLSGLEPSNSQSLAVHSIHTVLLEAPASPGQYDLFAYYPGQEAICGWLAFRSSGCILSQVQVTGVPLPEGATNFEDKIALLSIEMPESQLQPGGQLSLYLTWQAIGPLLDDYTVFVQVLDEQDKIVGQVDSWPMQGTLATGQWLPGQIVEDPYLIQLDKNLPPGAYKLNIGWYLLETLRRLPVVKSDGVTIDDKFEYSGLMVTEP